MTGQAMASRIAAPYLTSQQRREAPAPPQPEGLRGFWPGALLLVSQRPQRVFSFLAPRTQPKFAAALLYELQTWCTRQRAELQAPSAKRQAPQESRQQEAINPFLAPLSGSLSRNEEQTTTPLISVPC